MSDNTPVEAKIIVSVEDAGDNPSPASSGGNRPPVNPPPNPPSAGDDEEREPPRRDARGRFVRHPVRPARDPRTGRFTRRGMTVGDLTQADLTPFGSAPSDPLPTDQWRLPLIDQPAEPSAQERREQARAEREARREQRRIARMQVNSLNLADRQNSIRRRMQAQADANANRQRRQNDLQQERDNRRAQQRTQKRAVASSQAAKAAKQAAIRTSSRVSRYTKLAIQAGSGGNLKQAAVYGAGAIATRMGGAAAGKALVGALGPIAATAGAVATAFVGVNLAAQKFARDGLYEGTKALAKLNPLLWSMIGVMEAIDVRFNRDKDKYREFSSRILYGEAQGEVQAVYNRMRNANRRTGAAGGATLNELIGERQSLTNRFNVANESLEAEVSKALYKWSNRWLEALVNALEVINENKDIPSSIVDGILNGLPSILDGSGGVVSGALGVISKAAAFWESEERKKAAKEDRAAFDEFQKNFQSNLQAMFFPTNPPKKAPKGKNPPKPPPKGMPAPLPPNM